MTNDQMFAQAIRNEIAGLRVAIYRAEGEINGLAKVLDKLEGGGGMAGGETHISAGGAEQPALPAPPQEPNEAGGGRVGCGGSDREGEVGGTE